jgi:hypothetical protein
MNPNLFVGAALAALLALSAPITAHARAGGEGNNTGCQGVGNPNSPCQPGTPGNSGNGGQGGAGGAGGNATVNNTVTNNLRAQAQARATARASAVGVGVGVGGAASATGGNATASITGTTGGAGGASTVTIGGDTFHAPRERLRTPDVSAPAIWSNNPCVVALSGGVAVAGFGASIGAGIEDRDCTRRANAQHLVAMGENAAAREVLCENREVRAAFARVGRPCAADIPAPAPREGIGGAVPVAATPLSAPSPARVLPAFCSVPGLNLASYPECR